MTRGQKNRFKWVLAAKRNELVREICERRDHLAIDSASDPMDQVRNIADRDFTVRNVDRMCAVLRLVEGALREIHEGTFGVCGQCGDDIPVKRLEAVPWSPYCVSCQERAEQVERDEESQGNQTPYALAG